MLKIPDTNTCELSRTSLTITYRCNLKCKLCSMCVPYYEIKPHFTYEFLSKTIDKYFEAVSFVNMFTLAGGEPLIHNEISKILEHLLKYSNQIGKIEIVTNGTIIPSMELLEVIRLNKEKICIMVDNYGEVSDHVNEIDQVLKNFDINYRIRKYFGDDAHCGGWVDFGDFSQKCFNEDEMEKLYAKCALPQKLKCFQITNGEMYPCSRSRRCMELNITPKNENEYINLLDEALSIDEKINRIINFDNLKSLSGCAYCNGMCDDSPRFAPAEQL